MSAVIIDLELHWSDPPTGADGGALAWGRGLLRVNGAPVWFGARNDSDPLEWSWIELLEFLAGKWAYLTTEQTYPRDLTPDEPRNLRRRLRALIDRTSSESLIDLYDEEVFRFEERHDLSRALRGMHVPSVFIVREGNHAWVTTDEAAEKFPLEQVLRDLELIAETIVERISNSGTTSSRAHEAVKAWSARDSIDSALLVRLATGIPKDGFSVRLPSDNLAFWELEPKVGSDSEIACAARMVKNGSASEEDRFLIVREVKKLSHVATPKADALAAKLKKRESQLLAEDPFIQGYKLATDVRYELRLGDGIVQPDQVLWDLSVTIVQVALSPSIDAVGCWGPKHGPAVLVNQLGTHAGTPHGRRATLAHEICHLLLDRSLSLPFAEVMGGRSPYRLERRANAFAAELLLPRPAVREAYAKYRTLEPTLGALQEAFGVGYILAAAQLKNAKPPGIGAAELASLEEIVSDDDAPAYW